MTSCTLSHTFQRILSRKTPPLRPRPLRGSGRVLPPGSRALGPAPGHEVLEVTIVVYKSALVDVGGRYRVSPEAMRRLRAFIRSHRLRLVGRLSARNITLRGTSGQLGKAFRIARTKYTFSRGTFYAYPGEIWIPGNLVGIVEGVIGLAQYPVDRVSAHQAPGRPPQRSFHPVQMSRLYNFPKRFNGRGQRIALIELGGGFRMSELRAFFRKQRLRLPKISVVSVDGVRNRPRASAASDDLEVQGDIETVGSLAPGAEIIVYFAPPTERGLYDAVVKAVHDKQHKPTIISVSFGEVEVFWAPRTLQILDDVLRDAGLLGITVCCAAGDTGSSGGVQGGRPHVYFPASSPHVLACGGTELTTRNGRIVQERVWQAGRRATTGGGVSRFFARPLYQLGAGVPPSPNKKLKHGRGLPDVAANAAGYRLMANGKPIVIGGTSAVAPLWAGLIARINEQRAHPLGFINPMLYGMYEALTEWGAIRGITRGNNGHYRAHKGWNPCTGLGCPDGTRLSRHLSPER